MDFANLIFALDAWRRGDEAEMRTRIEPLEKRIDEYIASGFDHLWVHTPKAVFHTMRGDTNLALDHLEKAAFRSIMPIDRMAYFYKRMGWDQLPEFNALRERHRQYVAAEHDKLLAVACGPDGFQVWQPSPEECGRNAAPGVPN